jgi:PleD family two-component response regulator
MIVVRLDDDSIMTDTSSEMLDQVLHAVAVEIVNTGIPDSLNFRLRDNACVTVIPQGSVDAARDGAIAVRQAIRESPLFPLPVTVSIGYGDSHALRALSDGKGALADAVMAGLMTILVRLRTQGPRAWVALSGGDPTAERLRTVSVLIVTADRLLSESLAALLHARGIPSRTVTNGRDALTFDRSVPAVVVADKATPQLDAYQIRQEYLSMNVINSVPFVLVTDYKSPETVERSLALGIEHIFVRPVDLEHLAGLCTLLLGRRG